VSDHPVSNNSIKRRAAFSALSAFGALAFAGEATASEMPSMKMPERQSHAEKANLKLLDGFFEAWRQGADAATLGRFLAPDCVVRLGAPYDLAVGRAAAVALFEKIIADGTERRMIVSKTQPFGPLVLNLRSMTVSSPLRRARANRVVGVFAFAGSNEIRDWTDHVVPEGWYFI
jgi:hypothetical protein